MNPDRWNEVEKLYHAAIERDPPERAAFLDQCPDEEVRREVQSLLEHEQDGDRLLENPHWKPSLGQAISDQSGPSLAPGTRLGPYQVVALMGAGGMGEVYRARDATLGRDVALKVLPEAFARDANRMARFGREARVLASLNHTNIAAIYGLEETGGIRAIVMELVEGPTLAERIGGRAMLREEALVTAKQIAGALEYAHEKGIIHRDLKPANVKLTADGNVKVLDFGLAKALEGPVPMAGDQPPTLTAEGTQGGVILGTAAYMAPEQAQGKPVDRRADIWAFGVVLYEMLTGKQLYTGDTSAEILASVIKDAPSLEGLPADVRYIIDRCLRKDPRQRWQSIGDVRIAIDENLEAAAGKRAVQRRPWRQNRVLGFGLAAGLLAGLSTLGFWLLRHPAPGGLSLSVPLTTGIGFTSHPYFSPDGQQIAFSWRTPDDPTSSIYVKMVGANTELRVTDSPGRDVDPTWSPDGRFIAFYRAFPGHSGYYAVSPLGGPVRQILSAKECWGNDWFPDGKHLAVVLPGSGIFSVDVETGEKTQLSDSTGVWMDHAPNVSPDGRMLAFVRVRASNTSDIYLVGSTGGTARRLTNFGTNFVGLTWTPDSRELVFEMDRDGVSGLWRMAINGGEAHLIMSSTEGLCCPILSRQGHRLAYIVSSGRIGIWRTDISGSDAPRAGPPIRLISSARDEEEPMYSPDGRKIAFSSVRTGPSEVWEADADGKALVQLTHLGGENNGMSRWSPDGSAITFNSRLYGDPEIMVVTEEGRKIRRITNNPAEDVVSSWSADGRWIYFASNRNGDFQIYKLRSDQQESPSNPPVQVTKRGGIDALESPDGKYLYYSKGRDKSGGLWRRRLDVAAGETEEPVLESLQHWGWWALGPNGVFFLESNGQPPKPKVHLKLLDLSSKRTTDLLTLQFPINPATGPLAVSPDGRHVLFEQQEEFGDRIVMIENFR